MLTAVCDLSIYSHQLQPIQIHTIIFCSFNAINFNFSSSFSSFPLSLRIAYKFVRSNGSTNTLTNDVKEGGDNTPMLLKKKKSHSAPESDTSSNSIYDSTTPIVRRKKLSLDGNLLKRDISSNTIKEFIKEKNQKFQEKDMNEASSYCSSIERTQTASPAATLTSVRFPLLIPKTLKSKFDYF